MNEQKHAATNEQNRHRQVWGSLAAKLEAVCREDGGVNGHSSSASIANGSGPAQSNKHALQQGHGKARKSFQQDLSAANHPYKEFEIQNSVAVERGDSQRKSSKVSSDLPLRHWIKGALDSIGRSDSSGISSMEYLKPSLKIAVFLSQQVSEAEECARNNYFDKLRLLPISTGSVWTGYVMVRLKTDGGQKLRRADSNTNHQLGSSWDAAWPHEPLPLATGTTNSTEGGLETTQDMNQKLEDLLESFGVGELEGTAETKCDGTLEMTCAFGNSNAFGNQTHNTAPLKTEGLKLTQNTRASNDKQLNDLLQSFNALEEPADATQKADGNIIHLSGKWNGDDAWLHEPLPSVTDTTNSTVVTGRLMETSYGINQQVAALLQSLDVLGGTAETKCDSPLEQNSQASNEQHHESWTEKEVNWLLQPSDTGGQDEKKQDSNEELDIFLKSFHLDESEAAPAQGELKARALEYLNIASAEIRCPRRQPFIGANTVADERRRIFQLGLAFYVLFSGGKAPPPGLLALASTNGAFVSLPTSTLTEKTGDDCEFSNDSKPKRRFSLGSGRGIGHCQASLESLKLLGIPSQLCNLISNMLSNVYGDLSSEDCYTNINDVTSDLQLMLMKPQKFLQDNMLSLSGFQLNETVFSREQEFASIQACYRRSVSESYELAIVAGSSGTGKSWLAQRLGRFIVAQGGQFLWGKFDQLQQVKPFTALASAFDQYCDVLISNMNADWVKLVLAKLQEALGQDMCHLIKVVPKLSQILPRNLSTSAADTAHDLDSMHALQRLCYLFCQFVDVISTYSLVSVTLCLDDIQWCDKATMLVLNQLLIKRHKKFFFIGCLRNDEMNSHHDHPFWQMRESVRSFGVNITTVKLDCIKKDTLLEMVSDLLCLPPRLVRSLTEILFTKTKGNPLFFVQLMLSLNRDGLLRLSLVRSRWVWNESEIQSRKLPDNAAICFANGIRQLPLEVQLALRTLSLFGASVKDEYIIALESQLNLNLVGPLNIAASEGLITHLKGSLNFCHDRIQEACYDMIEEKDRRRDHSLYGLCLVKSALQSGNDDMLFVAVNQINFGGVEAVIDTAEFAAMARYNLMAAKSATCASDFSTAYYFASHGISFLRRNPSHWTEQYHLSLELFELASKSALATGNSQSLHCLADELMKHCVCFEDKLNTYYIWLSWLKASSKVLEALDRNRRILAQLDEIIPSTISKELLNQHIQQTQSMIRGISHNDFLNYKLMTDNRMLTTMRFLAKLEVIALMVNPTLHQFVTLRMVQVTISYGVSPVSPTGFAYFGSLLAKRGKVRIGHKFSLLAKRLLDKLNAKGIAGEVTIILAEIQCFVEPTEASNELRVECESAAMAGGDIMAATTSRLQYCVILFWVGTNLSVFREACLKACRFMQELGHQLNLFFMQVSQRSALTLAGREYEANSGNELLKRARENKNPRQLMILSFHNLYLSFILDFDCEKIKECCENFIVSENCTCGFLFYVDTVQAFFVGLSSFRIFRTTRDSLWLERARKCKSEMKLWAEEGSQWNFQHKLLLLKAEESYSVGDFDSARDLYNKAIQSAKLHKAINDEALSCELAAKFYMETNERDKSLQHFRLALEKYLDWGALKKADLIFELIEDKFSNIKGANPAAPGTGSIIETDQRKRTAM